MRIRRCLILLVIASLSGDDPICRNVWASALQAGYGATLLEEFRKRTLTPPDLDKIQSLIQQLSDATFAAREHATARLVGYGAVVVPLLREALPRADLEQQRRLDRCLKLIANDTSRSFAPTAPRFLAVLKPPGTAEALIAYYPWAESAEHAYETHKALAQLASEGEVSPLVTALGDSLPGRRALAAEVLTSVPGAKHHAAIRKLFADPHPRVRLCTALALARTGVGEAVPVLIDLASDLPQQLAAHADDLLRRLAGGTAPTIAFSESAREDYRRAWRAWWTERARSVGWAQLAREPNRKPIVKAVASKTGPRDPVHRAFDGDRKTAWNSSGFPPQWIEADLGAAAQLRSIVLIVNQHPAGDTIHEIWVANEPIGDARTHAKRVHIFKGSTKSQQELTFNFPKETLARYVQIRTTDTIGWVAWMEIDLRVGSSLLSYMPGLGKM